MESWEIQERWKEEGKMKKGEREEGQRRGLVRGNEW